MKSLLLSLSLLFSLLAPSALAADEKHLYLLPEAVDNSVNIDALSHVGHYALETLIQAGKAYGVYHFTGQPIAGLTVFGGSLLLRSPSAIMIRSSMDLSLRDWFKNQKLLGELAEIPNIEKIQLIQASHFEFNRVLTEKKVNRAVVFFETTQPLPEDFTSKWGKPIELSETDSSKLLISLSMRENQSAVQWEVPLQEVLKNPQIPSEHLATWQNEVVSWAERKSWFKRLLRPGTENPDLKLEAKLLLPSGEVYPIGAIAQGRSVRGLLNMTWFSKLTHAAKRLVGLAQGKRPNLPLSNVQVISAQGLCIHEKLNLYLGRTVAKPESGK